MIIDVEGVLDRLGRNPELARRIIRLFADQFEKETEELRVAAAGGRLEAVGRIAHGLAGAASTVSAGAVRDLAKRLEHRVRIEATTEGVPDLIAELADRAAELRAELPGIERELDSTSAPP